MSNMNFITQVVQNLQEGEAFSENNFTEELDTLVVLHHLSKDKTFLPNREKMILEASEKYSEKLLQTYARFERFKYFNNLPFAEQIQTTFLAAIVFEKIANDPEWLIKVIASKYSKLTPKNQMTEIAPGVLARDITLLEKFNYPVLLTNAVFNLCILYEAKRQDTIIDKTLQSYDTNVSEEENAGYEIIKLYADNPEQFLSASDVERIQMFFTALPKEFGHKKGWKYKEKKTVQEVLESYTILLKEKDQLEIIDALSTVFGVADKPATAWFADSLITLAEWAAITKGVWDYENTRNFLDTGNAPEGFLTPVFKLERWLTRRDKIEASKNHFNDKITLMRLQKEAAFATSKKAKPSDFSERERQLEGQILALKGDLKLANSKYQLVKKDYTLTGDANRLLRSQLQEAHSLIKKYMDELDELKKPVDSNECGMFEIEEDAAEEVVLPDKIAMITGHPGFRNNIKSALGWDTVDIDKSELFKLKKADLIVYNSASNAHRIFEALSEEDFEKLVYVGRGTNIELLVKRVKEGWRDILEARKDTSNHK